MNSPVFLRVYYKGELVNIKQFSESQVVIGSGDDAILRLDNSDVSAVHAVIERRDSGYYITDLGSEKGTFKNGNKILDDKIESGEAFSIADYKIEFFIGVPKPLGTPVPEVKKEEPVKVNVDTKPTLELIEEDTVTQIEKAEPDAKETKPSSEPGPKPKIVPQPKPEPKPKTKMPLPKQAFEKKAAPKSSSKAPRGTFAPPSENKDLSKVIKPSRGATVEVSVAWKERVIGTYLYKDQATVKIGSKASNDIVVPLLGMGKTSYKLLKLDKGVASIFISPEMTGQLVAEGKSTDFQDLIKLNRLVKKGNGFVINLAQGELIKLNLFGDTLSIYIKYKEEIAAPIGGPLLDLSFAELTGFLVSMAIVAIFGLYMLIYSAPEEEKIDDPLRKVTVTFNSPKPQPKKIIEIKEVKVVKKTRKASVKKKAKAGKMKAVRKTKRKTRKKKKMISAFAGGSVKTGKKRGSSAKSKPKKKVEDLGLLSAFGGGGVNNKLAK
ncbi:FHA domain-containing protein, partial [bacterium]|nr:FHA domain-containing protein [bacterium]